MGPIWSLRSLRSTQWPWPSPRGRREVRRCASGAPGIQGSRIQGGEEGRGEGVPGEGGVAAARSASAAVGVVLGDPLRSGGSGAGQTGGWKDRLDCFTNLPTINQPKKMIEEGGRWLG